MKILVDYSDYCTIASYYLEHIHGFFLPPRANLNGLFIFWAILSICGLRLLRHLFMTVLILLGYIRLCKTRASYKHLCTRLSPYMIEFQTGFFFSDKLFQPLCAQCVDVTLLYLCCSCSHNEVWWAPVSPTAHLSAWDLCECRRRARLSAAWTVKRICSRCVFSTLIINWIRHSRNLCAYWLISLYRLFPKRIL